MEPLPAPSGFHRAKRTAWGQTRSVDTFLLVGGGLALLAVGAELLVRSAASIARLLGISPFLIGLTVIAWGTSTPELVTSIAATLADAPGLVVGNIVGTGTANILLILGISALLRPFAIDPLHFRRDSIVVAATSLTLTLLVLYGSIGRIAGSFMIAAVVVYAVHAYRAERSGPTPDNAAERTLGEQTYPGPSRALPSLILGIVGLVFVIVGAEFLVKGAVAMARLFMVSETVIGLTVVAVGTSVPELMMGFIGAVRQRSDIAYGNIIGSHIYNTLFILGLAALVKPFDIPAQILSFDIWVLLAATALLVFFGRTGFKLSRLEGIVFVAAYAVYVWYLIVVTSLENSVPLTAS